MCAVPNDTKSPHVANHHRSLWSSSDQEKQTFQRIRSQQCKKLWRTRRAQVTGLSRTQGKHAPFQSEGSKRSFPPYAIGLRRTNSHEPTLPPLPGRSATKAPSENSRGFGALVSRLHLRQRPAFRAAIGAAPQIITALGAANSAGETATAGAAAEERAAQRKRNQHENEARRIRYKWVPSSLHLQSQRTGPSE